MKPQRLDHYLIKEELGRGAMAVVYRAVDERLARDVALKVLHAHVATSADHRERFEREARAVARLRHPGIISVFDCSFQRDPGYICTELVDGPSLRRFVEEAHPWLPEIGMMIGAELAAALAHAHDQGVIHRDIKPENVILSKDGQPKLADFGLARVTDTQTMTATGALIGSPAHMSPEVIEGAEVDARSDLFSFGTVLYHVMTGRLPFEASNPAAMMRQIVLGRIVAPETHNAHISRGVAKILRRCLAPDPTERFASAHEVERALRAELSAIGIHDVRPELAACLADPAGYQKDLAARITLHLRGAAAAALRDRRLAAALAIADRLTLLAPDDGDAAALVARIRGAEQRRRTAIGGVAALAGAGLLFGLVVLVGQHDARRGDPTTATPAPAPADAPSNPVADTGGAARPEVDADDAAPGPAAAAGRPGETSGEDAPDAAPLTTGGDREPPTRREGDRRPPDGPGTRSPAPSRPVAEPDVAGASLPATAAAVPVTLQIWPLTAVVTIDGVRYGDAQQVATGVTLTPGRHLLQVNIPNLPDARLSREFEVRAEGPNIVRAAVPWPPATLMVVSSRPASVFVDGRHAGETNRRIEVPISGARNERAVSIRVIPNDEPGRLFESRITLRTATEGTLTAPF